MPNLKISQLTGGGAAQAADEFVVARSGGNNKITGANVAAAATSVGTLTSLTVGGNLTVDTNTLFVDAANNSVGIGTTSPTQRLHLSSSGNPRVANNTSAIVLANSVTSRVSLIGYDDSQNFIFWNSTNAAGATQFYSGTGSGTLQMTLDSTGNLGLGVTPSATQSSYKSIEMFGTYWMSGNGTTPSTNLYTNGYFDGSNRYKYTGFAASSYQSYNGIHAWLTAPSGTAGNAISFTQAMTLDASGNLGVGTATPGGRLHVRVGTDRNLAFQATGFGGTKLNSYNDASSANVPIEFDASTHYFTSGGVTRWQINTSGHLLAGADATYDIGASGATRPRDLYLSGNVVGGGWVRAGAASAGAASTTTIGSTTATTVGAAGGASALPATPLGYIIAHVGTTQVKIPYYNN